MKISYINHSGFFVEQEQACLLFDYWKGTLPEPMDRPLFIFASHSHKDHFNPVVLDYGRRWKDVFWILADEISPEQVPEELRQRVLFAAPCQKYEVTAGGVTITVETLRSTDLGNAYLVSSEGKTIYHAGDLHLWLWREDEQGDREMQAAFEREIQALRGRTIDAAFLPVDPRQGADAFLGLDYTARLADIKRIYPMHCWGKYRIIQKLIEDPCSEPYRSAICTIRKGGCTDDI